MTRLTLPWYGGLWWSLVGMMYDVVMLAWPAGQVPAINFRPIEIEMGGVESF